MTDTTTRLLRRLLDEPRHVEAVRSLEPRRFDALVGSVSLEDAGELLAMATPAQTLAVLDREIWRSDPAGAHEHLDAERFATWLEVLFEGGEALVAQALGELPEELLTAALCGQLFVLDLDALGHGMAGASWDEAELAERVLDEALHLELDRYTLVARHALGWDPTIAALLALDQVDHDRVERVLAQCHRATREELEDEDDGLHSILRAQETIEVDAHAEREDRRGREGYVSRASARSFLALAERTSLRAPEALETDPITRAYFRELQPPTPATEREAAEREAAESPPSRSLRALVEHIDQVSGGMPAVLALPVGAEPESGESSARAELRRGMQALAADDPARHADQLARLAYLANVLLTAGKPDGSAYGLLEATEVALEHVARGLARLRAEGPAGEGPRASLGRVGVDALFRLGFGAAEGVTPRPERATPLRRWSGGRCTTR